MVRPGAQHPVTRPVARPINILQLFFLRASTQLRPTKFQHKKTKKTPIGTGMSDLSQNLKISNYFALG
jgi:hypothetical protein